MTTWQEIESKYYMNVVRRQPVNIVRGQGTRVWDENDKEYLDFTAGWAVNNLGHCHPVVVDAIREQAATLMQTSNQFYTVPQLKLAQVLVDNSCMDRVFFCNSGAEANEGAVKLARKYGKLNRNGAYEVITALNSFHGRTLAMVAATGQPHYQANWMPLTDGFVNVEYNDLDAIKSATTDKTCAVLLEPIQAEGGVNVPEEGYLKAVREWCDQQGLLLIFDEVQTGMGRLGTLFGYESFDVEPDVMTLAKGLGGGVPIGAFLAKEHASVLEPGDHGSTFGGNALTCAASNAATRFTVSNDIPARAREMGAYLKQGLEVLRPRHANITDVRGMGLLLALEFNEDIAARLVSACNEEGLLLNPVRPNAIRFIPPLTISRNEIDQGLERLERGLQKVV
jgi:acetylornithine aminotransferase/acetylornithine/N-succinyldiaminopimelate aminotransferase